LESGGEVAILICAMQPRRLREPLTVDAEVHVHTYRTPGLTALARLIQACRRPWSIDHQLRRDSKLRRVEYQVLAMRSGNPDRTMRMSALADIANASLSRLSHVIERLERRGFVRRAPDRTDGRLPKAALTDEGFQALAAAAPGHVRHLRSLVVDVLSPERCDVSAVTQPAS
jgi:DNA-binding MarR family transcriptional regulator